MRAATVRSIDPRVQAVRESVRTGDSFLDVGGVKKLEMVTIAHEAGAVRLTMADIRPEEDPLWAEVSAPWNATGLSVERLSVDISDLPDDAWDVVHCGSVLHHVANVPPALAALRRVTRRSCILSVPVCEPHRLAALHALVGPHAAGLTAPDAGSIEDWRWLPTPAQLREAVALAGFTITAETSHWHDFLLTLRLG
jgi:2-polyprenyl-3-methyl-5-hydroxy-6-metoxy-1,4-benzoquinol methylase